jgi:hypothetical protein
LTRCGSTAWRGPVLADVTGEARAAGGTQLEELRLAAVKERLDLKLLLSAA